MVKTFLVSFGSSQIGLTDVAYQLFDNNDSPVGSSIHSGVYEIGEGDYGAEVTFPDVFDGYIKWTATGINSSPISAVELVYSAGASSQYGVVITVEDQADNPVVGALVQLVAGAQQQNVVTSSDGVANFQLNYAEYNVSISAGNFNNFSTTLIVSSNLSITYNLTLSSSAIVYEIEAKTSPPVVSGNVYAIVYGAGPTSGLVWNNSTSLFEAWVDGHESDYIVDLTQMGTSGRWVGMLPTAVVAPGCYPVEVYLQEGSEPVLHGEVQDALLAEGKATRPGGSGTFGVPQGVSQYALTSLASVKAYMRITNSTSDLLLIQLINAISMKIERLCGRQFLEREYQEWYGVDRQVVLRQFPVRSIDGILVGKNSCIQVGFSQAGAIEAFAAVIPALGTTDAGVGLQGPTVDGINSPGAVDVRIPSAFLRLTSTDENGNRSKTDLSFSTYRSAKTLVEAINAIPGWSAQLLANCPTANIQPFPGQNCILNSKIPLNYPNIDDTDAWSSVDYETGIVYRQQRPNYSQWSYESYVVTAGRWTVDNQYLMLVRYTAGYQSVPADLSLICNMILADAFNMGLNDRTLASENIKDYGYRLADASGISEKHWNMLRQGGFAKIAHGYRT